MWTPSTTNAWSTYSDPCPWPPMHGKKQLWQQRAEASLVQGELASRRYRNSSKESYGGHRSGQTRHCSCSCTCRDRKKKSSELDSTVSMCDANARRKDRCNRCVALLNILEPSSDHSVIKLVTTLTREQGFSKHSGLRPSCPKWWRVAQATPILEEDQCT